MGPTIRIFKVARNECDLVEARYVRLQVEGLAPGRDGGQRRDVPQDLRTTRQASQCQASSLEEKDDTRTVGTILEEGMLMECLTSRA